MGTKNKAMPKTKAGMAAVNNLEMAAKFVNCTGDKRITRQRGCPHSKSHQRIYLGKAFVGYRCMPTGDYCSCTNKNGSNCGPRRAKRKR